MTAIGIDMSKATFHVAFDEERVRIFQNTEEGIGAFFEKLDTLGVSKGESAIGVEATGAYHLLLCMRAKASGWRIVVINPLESSQFIKAQSLRRLKTDRKDALVVRKMVALGRGYPFMDTDGTLALKGLISEREGLVSMLVQIKGRREAHAAKQMAVSGTLHDSNQAVLAVLQREIRAIEKRFVRYEPKTQELLRSIPGVGTLTAAALVAYIADVSRFSSPEKLVAYIGLDCRVHESGTSIKGKGFMTKRGNAYLRHILFNAAFVARRHNPELKKYFEKKRAEGKHYFSALCAVERKLIHLIYAVWKRGTPFEARQSTYTA